jgi:hypothetical protein
LVPLLSQAAPPDSTATAPSQPAPYAFKNLKQLLKQRYEGRDVHVAVAGLSAGEQHNMSFLGKTSINSVEWHHYYPTMTIPKRVTSLIGPKIEDMTRLDDRTFGHLGGDVGGLNVTPIDKGEVMHIFQLNVSPENIQFVLAASNLAHMHDFDVAKAGTQTTRSGNTTTTEVGGFGLAFNFYLPKSVTDHPDSSAVLAEIAKYLLLPDQWRASQSAETNVQIRVGMEEADVIRLLGQPLRSVTFGDQETLKYKDLTIILKSGKVADVRLD